MRLYPSWVPLLGILSALRCVTFDTLGIGETYFRVIGERVMTGRSCKEIFLFPLLPTYP